jgi:outer membrane biosynthesis protein TonB/CheY-like chemotaxis protein
MTLRCLLFSSDEGTSEPILQVLTALGVEGELCREAAAAVEKVTEENFQIVILDWDKQPDSAQVLARARERKAAERPLTLAIVSDDISVPKALQAGANSILRKPLVGNQIRDTLTTARDLLRAKQESAQAAAAGASAIGAISSLPANLEQGSEKTLRAGEFLNSAPSAPGGQFVTESEVHEFKVSSSVEKDLEPMAASVEEVVAPPPPPPPETGETRGLEWYLKTRGGTVPQASGQSAAAAAPALAKPDLLGYDQTPAYTPAPAATLDDSEGESAPQVPADSSAVTEQGQEQSPEQKQEQRKEAELFSYITEGMEPEKAPRAPLRLGKGAIIAALAVASCAIVAAPQAPWHAGIQSAWAHGRQTVHGWLNPQLVTTPQAPIAHEDFGRAGDEYKLPVTENIPDATTDPSQIHVIPVVDPTVKKLNNMGENAEPALLKGDVAAAPADPTADPGTVVPLNPNAPSSSTPETAQPAGGTSAAPGSGAVSTPAVTIPPTGPTSTPAGSAPSGSNPTPGSGVVAPVANVPHSESPAPAAPTPSVAAVSAPTHTVSAPTNVPSSLKSQMASMTPDAGGNKAPEAAMQAIEPVVIPEAAERALLTDQPAVDFPANSTGQAATVTLQVLVGRDGTVQDAKFMQGSLAFARVAIDGVKRWKFKPYIMNGRPVSVQTPMTISFAPQP